MRMAPTKYLVPDGQPHKGDAVLAPPAHTLHCLGSLCFCLLICKQQLIAVIRAFFPPRHHHDRCCFENNNKKVSSAFEKESLPSFAALVREHAVAHSQTPYRMLMVCSR